MGIDMETGSSLNRKYIGKRFILFFKVLVVAVIVLAGMGDATASEVRFGLRAGYNGGVINMNPSSFDGEINWVDGSFKFGDMFKLHAGVSVDIPITEVEIADKSYYIGLNPSILFVWKGGDSETWHKNWENETWVQYDGTYKIDAYYLDVPIPVSIERRLSDSNVLGRLEVGPYISFGLSGDQVLTVPTLNIKHSESAFSSEGLARVGIGIFYGIVIEFFGFYVGQHICSGFSSPSTTFYYVTVGYTF